MNQEVEVSKPELFHMGKIEQVLMKGDLAALSEEERVTYYKRVCDSLGLNPLTRPFEYIVLNGKLTFYTRKDCTEQLRRIHNVSITSLTSAVIEGVCVVTAIAQLPSGRSDPSTGAVSIIGLKGDALANAFMKAETKAKRRATLSICGLGILDETEVETIPETKPFKPSAVIEPADPLRELRIRVKKEWETTFGTENNNLGFFVKENINPNAASLKDLSESELKQVLAYVDAQKDVK